MPGTGTSRASAIGGLGRLEPRTRRAPAAAGSARSAGRSRRAGSARRCCRARSSACARGGSARRARRARSASGPRVPELDIVDHRAQRGDGAVRARIAEPAALAHRERPGIAVGAVGVHELGRDQHGLAVALRRRARRLGVAPLLALVELGDAVEPVAREERARCAARAPGSPGCRGRGRRRRRRRDARRRGRARRGSCRASRRRRGRPGSGGSSAPAPSRRCARAGRRAAPSPRGRRRRRRRR